MRKFMMLAATAVMAATATLTVASPAMAINPPCGLMMKSLITGKVWCDGTGPGNTYEVVVTCTGPDGDSALVGPRKWAGDRTGSAVTCPSWRPVRVGNVIAHYYQLHNGSYYLVGSDFF